MSAHDLTLHAGRRLRSVTALATATVALAAAATSASAAVTFAPGSPVPGITDAAVLTTGDINSDGHPDIVAPSYPANSVFVASGAPGGVFDTATPFTTRVDGGG